MKVLCTALTAAVLAGTAGGEEFKVELEVAESAGAARKAEPISGGVPLPRGRFKTGQPFAFFKPGGREVPCQVTPLVAEPDGTLRWILLDFQGDVPAKGTSKSLLKAVQPRAKSSVSLRVKEDADAVTVDTGRIKFVVDKKAPFGLFKTV